MADTQGGYDTIHQDNTECGNSERVGGEGELVWMLYLHIQIGLIHFLAALVRCHLHTIKFTHVQCRVESS